MENEKNAAPEPWQQDMKLCRVLARRMLRHLAHSLEEHSENANATIYDKAEDVPASFKEVILGNRESLSSGFIALSTLLIKLHSFDHQREKGAEQAMDLFEEVQQLQSEDMAILERFVARGQDQGQSEAAGS